MRVRVPAPLLWIAILVLVASCGTIRPGSSHHGSSRDGWADGTDPSAGVDQSSVDPISNARSGDCFNAAITASRVDLTSTTCGPGTYELVQRLDYTTDSSRCEGFASSDYAVSYPDRQVVLCLSYQYSDNDAAHAQPGACIGQSDGSDDWYTYDCQPGAFKVLARYHNTTSYSRCGTSQFYNYALSYTVPGNSAADLLLCLSFQYGSDAGYAKVGNCMKKAGPNSDFTLSFPSGNSCSGTNVVITGRDNTFTASHARSFCGRDGYFGQNVTRYPKLSYTVCWRPR